MLGNLKPNTTKRGNSFLKTQPLKRNILSRINSVRSFISSWIGCDLSLQYVRQLLLIYSAPAAFCFAISFCIWASISCIRRNWKKKKKDHFQTFIFGRRHFCSTKIWHQTSRLFNRTVSNWLSKVTTRLRFLCLLIGYYKKKTLEPGFQPLKSKTKTNRTLTTWFFPRFEQVPSNR